MNAKCEIKGSQNYAAVVVAVDALSALDGLDQLKGLHALGYQALVSANTERGAKMVLFCAGSQLSLEFATACNLHRHGNLNADTTVTGYLEDNRRVRALTLRGHRSDALAMPLESLARVLGYVPDLPTGTQFDTIDGKLICGRFTPATRAQSLRGESRGAKAPPFTVPEWAFPEHYDTPQFARNHHRYQDSDLVFITQKLHGTSVRLARVDVPRRLTWADKLARFFGAKIQETEPAFVVGSRRTIKSVTPLHGLTPEPAPTDTWSKAVQHLAHDLPSGFVFYGELVGWTSSGAPIQKGYTYNLPQGASALFVYRVACVSEHGAAFDLSFPDVQRLCARLGLLTVPLLGECSSRLLQINLDGAFLNMRLADQYPTALRLSDPKSVDEGVCVHSLSGVVTKHKSPIFLGHESKMLDADVVDVEEAESAA